MLKLPFALSVIVGAAMGVGSVAGFAAPVGPDASRCQSRAEGSALLISISGLKSRAGLVRVQLYGADPAEFLAKGKKLRRIDVPVAGSSMEVCVALPQPGRYAIAVRHDADANRKSGWNDGGGFSRNPPISLTSLKPKYAQVAFNVGPGIHRVPVIMQYRRGLTIGPIKKQGG